MIRRVHPIHPHSAQVLHMKSDQTPSESVAHVLHAFSFNFAQSVSELGSETVSLPLEMPRDCIHADRDNSFQGRQDHLEEQEGDHGWRLRTDLFAEIKRAKERWGVQERGEQGENGEDMDLRDGHHLGRV